MSPESVGPGPVIRVTGAIPADERLTVEWPQGRGPCIVQPEIVEGWAESLNDARDEAARLSGLLRALLHAADNGFMAPEVRAERIAEIRKEFGS